MVWPAIIGAVATVGSAYAGNKGTQGALSDAAAREGAAYDESLYQQNLRFEEGRRALQPYANQEQAASTQFMAQLGLGPPAGGGGGQMMGGADPWGFAGPSQQDQDMAGFLDSLLADQLAIVGRAGYDDAAGAAEAVQGVITWVDRMKEEGALPADFPSPTVDQLADRSRHIIRQGGGIDVMAQSPLAGGRSTRAGPGEEPSNILERLQAKEDEVLGGRQEYGSSNVQSLIDQFNVGSGQEYLPAVQPGGGMIDPRTGEPLRVEPGRAAPGGGGAMTAGDIMGLAGVEGLPPELREQYIADLMEDPRTDPELAAYLGLTDESLQVGRGYQDTPAYMAAREAGIEAVDAAAAGAGGLYSGRRGKALRDVGQDVEQRYYFDAMDRRRDMMGARRGERGQGIARRGGAYETDQQRTQSYYNNYMSLLRDMAQPTTTTNIAQMGTDIGRATSSNLLGGARNLSDLEIGGAGANQAMYGDIAGGLMKLGEAFIGSDTGSRPGTSAPMPPPDYAPAY